MFFSDLQNQQVRQIIDVEQVYSAYRMAKVEHDDRYAGSMMWKHVGDADYLYRKKDAVARSLGPRSAATEKAHTAFHEGRERIRGRLKTLAARLNEMAPVNRALGIGRVPLVGARVLRHLDQAGLVGKAIDVVGTTAIYAYERMSGVQVRSDLLATGDVDLLLDSRRALKIVSNGVEARGLLGILRRADRSFALGACGSFRAVNDDGFMVDLIKPMPKDRLRGHADGGDKEDLQAVEIEGLAWLVNSPKHQVIVIDERGYPLAMSVPDPRSFALHKAWLSSREDREPIKRNRDDGQARLVAELAVERLSLRFDSNDLTALPVAMRQNAKYILPKPVLDAGSDYLPNW